MANKKLTVDQKFAKTIIELREIRPFYSAIYESMERVESKSIPTIGVSCNKMTYNPDFVDKLKFPELIFIQLHEIAHVALMHVTRRGNKDPELWNLACDLIVNKLLSEEFEILPGETSKDGLITFPEEALFCDSIDIDTDYVENIYEEFEKQAKQNKFFALKHGDLGILDDLMSDADNGQGKLSNSASGKADEGDFEFTYKGSKKTGTKHEKFKHKATPRSIEIDLIDNGADPSEQKDETKRILSDALVKKQMIENGTGSQAGVAPGCLERKVKNILKAYVDWRKLLRKYCTVLVSKDSSFAMPDKRMFYQDAIYPGQETSESNYIKGIKICIDTSGSISDRDLAYFNGQVHDIVSKYKVDAEVIYWDTEIASKGDFKDEREFFRITGAGNGGTDPSCVFEYFDSQKCKVKPIVTIVLTDGEFSSSGMDKPKWRRKYKDTIWVTTRPVQSVRKQLDFPFGKVTELKYKQ